jgi:hypothetical protein
MSSLSCKDLFNLYRQSGGSIICESNKCFFDGNSCNITYENVTDVSHQCNDIYFTAKWWKTKLGVFSPCFGGQLQRTDLPRSIKWYHTNKKSFISRFMHYNVVKRFKWE